MPFQNLTTHAFGLTDGQVRAALAHLSLPVDLTAADLTDHGFAHYATAARPATDWTQRVVEVAPIDGVQQWEVQARPETLDALKAERLEALAARRRTACEALTFNGAPFQLDPDTETAIAKTVLALARQPEGMTISWEVARGVVVPLDLPALEALGDAAFLHVQACFDNVGAITAAILAAETVEQLTGVDIEAGWPV